MLESQSETPTPSLVFRAPLYRLRGRFRRQILLKAPTRNDLRRLISAWQTQRTSTPNIREIIDIDPVDMM